MHSAENTQKEAQAIDSTLLSMLKQCFANLHLQAVVGWFAFLSSREPHPGAQDPRGAAEVRLGEPKSAERKGSHLVGDSSGYRIVAGQGHGGRLLRDFVQVLVSHNFWSSACGCKVLFGRLTEHFAEKCHRILSKKITRDHQGNWNNQNKQSILSHDF